MTRAVHQDQASPSRRLYWAVIAFRCTGAVLAIAIINALLPLGTSQSAVSVAAIVGIIGASWLARSRSTSLGFVVAALALSTAPGLAIGMLNWLAGLVGLGSLRAEAIGMHTTTCGIALAIAAAATWVFWRVRIAVTLEAIMSLLASIALFSAHREFHLDRPKILNSIAWRLGVDPLAMLVIVGSLLIVSVLAYLYLASLATRPQADAVPVRRAPGKRQIFLGACSAAILVLVVFGIQRLLYSHFSAIMLARTANGVGMGSKDGASPLSFQSALGSSNQPAALVRLEGDYSNNPFSPMMYMRETALSSFNGKEMVFAGRAFDTDIPVIRPNEAFTGKEDAELSQRTPLVQSVYLLADHDNAFAVDYPASIVQLKNPQPTRFKGSYRAYSVAPAYELSGLELDAVGDPRWTAEVRQHYLEQHPDKRYKETAEKITAGIQEPVKKARALADYLSASSIYTLTPRHEVKEGEDPVAPFLFGDHRGYCVHFAHAIVYMLRALGIPARVGTGYLTDLSQAKDGHILLRMSDRHAWGEVYVAGVGWVPFDVQPQQVESHAETQVDAKLLEELMGILLPGEEILPPRLTKDEKGIEEEGAAWIPDPRSLLPVLYAVAALLVITKLLLRFGWRLVPSPQRKLRLGYVAVASALYDAGISRTEGETRLEFAQRVTIANLRPLATAVVREAYGPTPSISAERVAAIMREVSSPLSSLPRWKRCLAALNPASVASLLRGGGW